MAISFAAKLGNDRVACGMPLAGLGANERDASLRDLRFFVHDVQLIDDRGKRVPVALPDDGLWQYQNVTLIDLEDATGDCQNGSPETNALVLGKVPEGKYTGVFFRIGVPAPLSHGDPASYRPPLYGSAMHWGWTLGYKFFRLELDLQASETESASSYEVHVGADTCSTHNGQINCARENIAAVELAAFDNERDKIVLDLAALLSGSQLAERPDDENVPGCASKIADRDCDPVFEAFGLDAKNGKPEGTQSIFSAQAREPGDLTRDAPDDSIVVEGDDAGASDDADAAAATYKLELPPGFPEPFLPDTNPLTAEKIELGRHLFYDKRLSANQTQACASCHRQELAFTDGRAVGLGSTGESHTRGAMSLANLVYATSFTWSNPLVADLEIQSQVPLFGDHPVELGLAGKEEELAERLRSDPTYQELFGAAFPGVDDPYNKLFIARAIASFERTLLSGNSAYDRYKQGDESALSASAERGEALFFDATLGERSFECFHCHGAPTFADQLTHANQPSGEVPYHNTGLYNLDVYGSYPKENPGIFEFTGRDPDRGRFKAPTLRNIAVTAPYMHDGSIATLEDVVAHYARGGRNVESGPNMGDGKLNRNKSSFIHGFSGASAQDRADLIELLKSLTDEEFLTNPKFGNPWP